MFLLDCEPYVKVSFHFHFNICLILLLCLLISNSFIPACILILPNCYYTFMKSASIILWLYFWSLFHWSVHYFCQYYTSLIRVILQKVLKLSNMNSPNRFFFFKIMLVTIGSFLYIYTLELICHLFRLNESLWSYMLNIP